MVLRTKGVVWLVLAMAVGCGTVEDDGLPPEPQEATELQAINLGYGADLF